MSLPFRILLSDGKSKLLREKEIGGIPRYGWWLCVEFTNTTLQEFIKDAVGLDIYNVKYEYLSGSKANLLRRFWEVESNANVAKLLEGFAEYYQTFIYPVAECDTSLQSHSECLKIAQRLRSNQQNGDVEAIKANKDNVDFEKLAKSIREDITNDKPDVAMDRLHTYLGRYSRNLCDKRSIVYDNLKPLNSIFGCYVKHLRENNLVESEMALKILNTSISVLEHFNDVRNNKSFAHPNTLLNYDESLLIFKYVSGLIVFIDTIEIKLEAEARAEKAKVEWNVLHGKLPF